MKTNDKHVSNFKTIKSHLTAEKMKNEVMRNNDWNQMFAMYAPQSQPSEMECLPEHLPDLRCYCFLFTEL